MPDQGIGQHPPGAPHHVKARHRIARRVQAALDPVRHREIAHAARAQPAIHLVGAVFDVGPRPGPRPVIVGSELGERAPVGVGQFGRIANAGAALFRGVDEEHAAETFARLPAQRRFVVAIEQQHPLTGLRQFQCGDDAGDAGADHQHIGTLRRVAHRGASARGQRDANTAPARRD